MESSPWRFVSIADKPEVRSFDCGVPELNDYLKRYAGQNYRKGLGNTFVLVPGGKKADAAGYHTLSMAQVDLHSLSKSHRKGLPKYPVPAVRLSRLAVDRKWQGQGLGEMLLMDAIHRVVAAVQSVAAKFMIVDAKSEKATGFYLKYGFHPFESGPPSLAVSIDTLKSLFKK